jgi:GntR family transcriptional regulator
MPYKEGRGFESLSAHNRRPERGAVVNKARELVAFARRHGYGTDELVKIIEGAT